MAINASAHYHIYPGQCGCVVAFGDSKTTGLVLKCAVHFAFAFVRAFSKLKFTGNKLTTREQVTFLEESYHRVNSKLDN